MSLPIKSTPILTGKDAKRFIQKMKEAETSPITDKEREDYKRAHDLYEKLKTKGFNL